MTVTTARRGEIVRTLQKLRSDWALNLDWACDHITDAIILIEGTGVPFDELKNLPSARKTDPDTSHEFKLVIGDAHRRYLAAYAVGVAGEPVDVWATELTPDEAAEAAGDEPGPGPRKRISELKRGGLLIDSGKRRPSALGRPQQVLTITEHGVAEARKLGVIA